MGLDFDGVLPWGCPDNRPILRCLHGLGLCLWRLGFLRGGHAVISQVNPKPKGAPAKKTPRRLTGLKPLVPAVGLEPTLTCVKQILSLSRLPFRHAGGRPQDSGNEGPGPDGAPEFRPAGRRPSTGAMMGFPNWMIQP